MGFLWLLGFKFRFCRLLDFEFGFIKLYLTLKSGLLGVRFGLFSVEFGFILNGFGADFSFI